MRALIRPRFAAWLSISLLLLGLSAPALEFLHTQGQDIVDEHGRKLLWRGVGLGNWLLPEGYMWHFGNQGDRPRRIEKIVSDLIGPEAAARFWTEYRRGYITEADIQRIATLGFNCVRVPLNARLFLTEGEHPVEVKEGFTLLDNLVAWCSHAGIYVIIDMHAAPGGQTGANIDDSADDQPRLFMEPANQDRLTGLWVKIASRYRAEAAVAGYDLLNEPLPERTGAAKRYKAQLEPLYRRVTAAIRAVDPRHLITIEGADWANDWSVFTRPFDANLVYQFHYYCWDHPTHLNSIARYLNYRNQLKAPIWVGETGEKDDTIYWATTDYFEANNIGWSFWPWKKIDARNAPYSIKRPVGWAAIAAYSRGESKPTAAQAQQAFDELLQNLKLENCTFFPDVINALFHRVPGRLECENYGQAGLNHSFYVKNASHNSKYYRTSEPVPVELLPEGGQRGAGLGIRLAAEEWTAYTVQSATAQSLAPTIRVKALSSPAVLAFTGNGPTQEMAIPDTGWVELPLKPIMLNAGTNSFKLQVQRGAACFDWVEFR